MFDYPPKRTSQPAQMRNQQYQMRQERRKPVLPGVWVYVGDFVGVGDPGNDPLVTTFSSPPWLNGWTWLGTAYVGFRHGIDGETEFIGVVDSSGATSGTVAFKLPTAWRPVKEFSFITDLDLGGGSFSAARVLVAPIGAGVTAGNVTIYFPIDA